MQTLMHVGDCIPGAVQQQFVAVFQFFHLAALLLLVAAEFVPPCQAQDGIGQL